MNLVEKDSDDALVPAFKSCEAAQSDLWEHHLGFSGKQREDVDHRSVDVEEVVPLGGEGLDCIWGELGGAHKEGG